MVSLTPLWGVGIFFALSIRAPTHKYGRPSASTRVHALRFAWPRATMGAHKSGWSASFRIGRPLAYRSRGHLRKWASIIHEVGIRNSGNVAWPRETMGVHLSGWASNLRQLRASTHKDWVSNFGGILVAHSQGLGFQLGWVWLSIVDRSGLPTWTNVVAQHGRSWASNLGGFGCPLWEGVDCQHGQTWLPNMDGVGHPTWIRMVAQDGRMWASKMGRSGCPTWTGCGYPSLPITGRPSPPIIGCPQLRVHHGCPLLGCHFMGVYGRPLLGIHPRPIIGHPRLSVVGRIPGRPFWTHVGPPERDAHVTCPRGVQVAT